MNKGKLSGLKAKHVRLRPVPKRLDNASGQWIIFDNKWFVRRAGRDGVEVVKSGCGDTLVLSAD
jgi:hypothetical protein